MNNTPINKKLATLMCFIFGTHLASLLYGMYAGLIMTEIGPKVFNIGNLIHEIPIIICAFLIATNNHFLLLK